LPNKNRISGLPKRERRERERAVTIKIPKKMPGRDQLIDFKNITRYNLGI
jgi:hypothetical protein